ncbi:MAG: response regulator [Candidatus Omnitrophica bacterium]|nr:response regulator [Candidatus Omnitrophota bacterium]
MRKILFVHDQEKIKDMISQYIRLNDFEVDTADNSTGAYILFEKEKYDLVICSETLDPLTGIELLKKIRLTSDENKRKVNMMLVGREDPDFKLSNFLAKYEINFITFYRRISIWVDKINVILAEDKAF